MHALIVAGAISQLGDLPLSWRRPNGTTVSNYYLRTDLHQADGWLPVVDNKPALGANQHYGDPSYVIGASQVTANYPVVADSQEAINLRTLITRAETALASNATFLGTVAARRTGITNGRATAVTMETATVTTFPQAQTQIRSIGVLLRQTSDVLTALHDQIEAATRQTNGIIRQLLEQTTTITDS
jgi:hypothetical protein